RVSEPPWWNSTKMMQMRSRTRRTISLISPPSPTSPENCTRPFQRGEPRRVSGRARESKRNRPDQALTARGSRPLTRARYNARMSADLISHYDYELPAELIASQPLPDRDASRLLTLDRRTGEVAHRTFRDFPNLLQPGDLLVLNQTRVVPAKLVGERTATGGRWEGLFLGCTDAGDWRLIGHTRGKLQPGESL